MNSKTFIDYDAKIGKFLLSVPFHQVELCQRVPNRRWHKKSKTWRAPAIRRNAMYLRDVFGEAEWSPEAVKAMQQALKPPKIQIAKFPFWFEPKLDPYPHQTPGNEHAYGLPVSALFMDMGTGKTKIACDVAQVRALDNKINAVLFICPLSIANNEEKEILKHWVIEESPAIMKLRPSRKKALEDFNQIKDATLKWMICGVETLSQGRGYEYAERFVLCHRTMIIVDESSRIKTFDSKRTERCISLGKLCKFRMIMTGTSITKGLIDLYAQFEFLDTNIIGIGDFFSFKNRYCVLGGWENREIIGYQNVKELMEIIKPYVYEVRKDGPDGVLDLPEKIYEKRYVELTGEQKRLYKDLAAKKLASLNGIEIKVENVLEQLLRLQQTASGFIAIKERDPVTGKNKVHTTDIVHPLTQPKIKELMDVIEEIEGQVIVWCRFKHEIAAVTTLIRKIYGNSSTVELHGGIQQSDRTINVCKFEAGEARFIVGNQAAGGIGIDLVAAKTVIYLSNTFNLEDRLQSEDRAHRIGQTKQVCYIDIVVQGSVDETILESIAAKQDMLEYVSAALRSGRRPESLADPHYY